jgi:divalent metal cation (Fe/Co/Zn/Cd) transporter
MRQRATAAALAIPEVREIHNVTVLRVGDSTELALHMKLPNTLTLRDAHEIADRVERAIVVSVPGVGRVHTHIEPLGEDAPTPAAEPAQPAQESEVRAIVRELTGAEPRELRFRRTEEGLLAFLTLASGERTLVEAHAQASAIEQRIKDSIPEIVEVVVHTEPGP